MAIIPSDVPQLVAAARSGALQALALKAGQVLDAKVIGPAPNGGTQVQLGGQILNLVLPTLLAAGTSLKLEVQGSGTQLQLAMQVPGTTQPNNPAPMAVMPDEVGLPQTSIPLSAASGRPTPAAVSAQVAGPATASSLPSTSSLPSGSPGAVTPQASSGTASLSIMPDRGAILGTASAQTAPAPVVSSQASVPQAAPPAAPTGPAPTILAGPPGAPAFPYPTSPAPAAIQSPVAAPAAGLGAGAARGDAPLGPAVPLAAAAPATPPGAAVTAAGGPVAGVVSQAPQVSPSVPPLPATPQAALAQMAQTALPRQDTILALTTALAAIAGKVALPEPVIRAAQVVMASRVPLGEGQLDGAALQKAVLGSGVFQEAKLAQGGVPVPQGDLKSALLGLRQNLTAWLGQMATVVPAAPLPPPVRGGVPRARGAEAQPIDPAAPSEAVGKQLLERTDSALARLRLHQHASLPEQVNANGPADWSTDVPVLINQQQAILHLQIHRDSQQESDSPSERGWQMRFAIAVPALGEVGAQVSLRGSATGVMLWADESDTAAALEAELPSLRQSLGALGLRPGAIFVRHGAPLQLAPAPSGHFVDSSS